MTKKLAQLLLQHKAEGDNITHRIKTEGDAYTSSNQYTMDYFTWSASGQQCLDEIKAYGNNDYMRSFYGNGKQDIYLLAEKYLKKLEKNRLHR